MKVAHVIKSKSFESDGRLLKWIASLNNINIQSEVFFVEDSNSRGTVTVGNTIVHKLPLVTRRLFKQRQGYLLKIPEYALITFKSLQKSDAEVLVFHDIHHYLNLFLILKFKMFTKKYIIWDLHELPHDILLKSIFTRKILAFIIRKVDLVVHTNVERRDFILSKLNVIEKDYFILNNYPDGNFLDQDTSDLPNELDNLRPNLPYILWLGGGLQKRNFGSFLKAYENIKNQYNLVILGSVDSIYRDHVDLLEKENVLLLSFVDQNEMIKYIDNAAFSVVLYRDNIPNNLYCEPNRLYQLLGRKIPVIVGSNPTMSNILKKHNLNYVLDDDGSNSDKLLKAIKSLNTDIRDNKFDKTYNYKSIITTINWDNQFSKLANLLLSVLKPKKL